MTAGQHVAFQIVLWLLLAGGLFAIWWTAHQFKQPIVSAEDQEDSDGCSP